MILNKKGLKRDTIDKYYTKNIVVNNCIELIKKYINININNDLIIEPSAGNGAFINNIKLLSNNYIFYDIEPDNKEIIKQDFLEFDYKSIINKYNKIHIIGNPPFGRQSSLAIKFIKKCCLFADSISFILPKSFKKQSMQKHFDNYFHLITEIDLMEKAFLVDNDEYDVPCIFQIWEKRDNKRKSIEKLYPLGFIFVNKTDNPDISFRRVGAKAGFISKDIDDKNIQSHYFIKFTNGKNIDDNIDNLKKILFDSNNTVGPKSISKQELIFEFNSILN